jgi:exopolyphosphatase/guanosine-5'-triphosphate,3'-diphosphate pyrophosphatase
MRVAAIDCGTNSIRLLVVDSATGELTRQMQIVRLGQDVDRTKRLAPEALLRTESALREYVATIREFDVDAVRMVATSAVRDAANRAEFEGMVRRTLGVPADIISGGQEAALSFAGAAGAEGAVLVADLGGGSTELVLGRAGVVTCAVSMDVGSVRMTERHLHADPPDPAQIAAVEVDVNAALDAAATTVALGTEAELIGVAGTITTIAAMSLGLNRYDSARIHGARLPAAEVEATIGGLLAMTRAERSAIAVLHPGRVDVIGAGAIIMRTLMHRVGAATITISEHDILDGIAASLLEGTR